MELLYEGILHILVGSSVTCRVDLLLFAGDRMNYCISGNTARGSASLLRWKMIENGGFRSAHKPAGPANEENCRLHARLY